jgi:hypothetical protein
VQKLVTSRDILAYRLEAVLQDAERGVAIRRDMLSSRLPVPNALDRLPFRHYDYSKVSLLAHCMLQDSTYCMLYILALKKCTQLCSILS